MPKEGEGVCRELLGWSKVFLSMLFVIYIEHCWASFHLTFYLFTQATAVDTTPLLIHTQNTHTWAPHH